MIFSCKNYYHLVWKLVLFSACSLWCQSKCETFDKQNVTLLDIISKNLANNKTLNESGLDDQALTNLHMEDPNLQRILNGLLNLNVPQINEQQMGDFFKGIMENPKVNEFGQQAVAVLSGFKDIQNLFRDPKNIANSLSEVIKKLPLDKLVNQIGGDSNGFGYQILSALKTGRLPSLTETALNPCKNLMNCSVIGQNYDDFKAIINLIDLDSVGEILNNPNAVLNKILSANFGQLIPNDVRNGN